MSHDRIGAKSFFPDKGVYLYVLLMVMFSGALAVRLYNVESPPLDFHEVRQYHSFLIARSFYYSSQDSAPEAEKKTALAARPPLLEPFIIEYAASVLYRIFGGESMVIPRLMSIIFWLASAVFLYLLARDLISPDAAVIALSFFLFLPYGVWASRSFQPDPLMVMFLLAALYSVFKYYRQPSPKNLGAASVLSAIAAFVKPVSLFPLFGAFIASRISTGDLRKIVSGRDMVIFAAVSVTPIILYSVYAYFFAGFLKDQVEGRFVPGLYMQNSYWLGWLRLVSIIIGKWPLILSLAGILLVRSGAERAFLLGLWIGYVVFGLVFTMHISTHDYYHLMLIPIVALSLGGAAAVLLERLAPCQGILRLGAWILFTSAIILSLRTSAPLLNDSGFEARIELDKEIGELVSHSDNTIILDGYYGNRLKYHGKLAGKNWPTRNDFESWRMRGKPHDRGKELLAQLITERSPEYFIISDLSQLEGQDELKEALDTGYAVVAETQDYIIYDLKSKSSSPGAE
ncbi:MAG: glycosyltransferase family 39 protein [Thermodesulfobacteriota bacterium]